MVAYHNSNTLLFCVYDPPETDEKPNSHQIPTDKEAIESNNSYRSAMLSGEFNTEQIDCNDYSVKDLEEQQLLDTTTQNDLQQIIDFLTYASGTLGIVFINSGIDSYYVNRPVHK